VKCSCIQCFLVYATLRIVEYRNVNHRGSSAVFMHMTELDKLVGL
jgi:hypothetical protein